MPSRTIGSVTLAAAFGAAWLSPVASAQDEGGPLAGNALEPENRATGYGNDVRYPTSARMGWYLRGGPMVQRYGDADFSIFEVEFETGGGFSIAGGIDFGSLTGVRPNQFNLGARAELELSGMAGDVDTVAGVPASGEVDATGLFVNGFLDFDFAGPVTLFTGLGLGHNRVEVDIDGFVDDDDSALGVQLMIGLEFEIDDDWLLYAMSRARWYDDMSFDGLDTEDFNSSSFEFGVRYSF